ncbi:diaminopimelate decarboxylase [Cutibacterium acnes JCM 18918]|nr:diaminopimelate decarboxylase [Cutibacterium acnes JCM 18918]
MALSVGVGRIIVDSLDEIMRIEQLCRENGWHARVMVRVTAGVEAHTHEYIATAHEDQKIWFLNYQWRRDGCHGEVPHQ